MLQYSLLKKKAFPGGTVGKKPPANAGRPGLIPGQGRKIPHDTTKTQDNHTNKKNKKQQTIPFLEILIPQV